MPSSSNQFWLCCHLHMLAPINTCEVHLGRETVHAALRSAYCYHHSGQEPLNKQLCPVRMFALVFFESFNSRLWQLQQKLLKLRERERCLNMGKAGGSAPGCFPRRKFGRWASRTAPASRQTGAESAWRVATLRMIPCNILGVPCDTAFCP